MRPELIVAATTIAVYLLRRIMPSIPTRFLPFASCAAAILANIAMPEGSASMEAVQNGLLEGLAASGLWSAAGKHVMPEGKK